MSSAPTEQRRELVRRASRLLRRRRRTREVDKRLSQALAELEERAGPRVLILGPHDEGKEHLAEVLRQREMEPRSLPAEVREAQASAAMRRADLVLYLLACRGVGQLEAAELQELGATLGVRRALLVVLDEAASVGSGERRRARERLAALLPKASAVSVVDLRDHAEGQALRDDDLKARSGVDEWLAECRRQLRARSHVSREHARLQLLDGALEDGQARTRRDDAKDRSLRLLLDQYERVVRDARRRLRTRIDGEILTLREQIMERATALAADLGQVDQDTLEDRARETEQELQDAAQALQQRCADHVGDSAEQLQNELGKVLRGDLSKRLEASAEGDGPADEGSAGNQEDADADALRDQEQHRALRHIAAALVERLSSDAVDRTSRGAGALYRASQVARPELNSAVLGLGQSAQLAQLTTMAVPFFAVGAFAMDAFTEYHSVKQAQKLASTRRELVNRFLDVGRDLEAQLESFLEERVEPELFRHVGRRIETTRKRLEEARRSSAARLQEMEALRGEVQELITTLDGSPRKPGDGPSAEHAWPPEE